MRNNYSDFNYTINSYAWLVPWIKDYFLNTSLLKISSLMSFFSLIYILIDKFLKKKLFIFFNRKNLFIILFFISCLYVWFKAPEIRFGWAIFISIPSFLIATEYNLFNKNKFLNHIFYYKSFLLIIIFLLVNKNLHNFNVEKIYSTNKNFDYSNIVYYGNFNNYEISISKNWKCYDYKSICVNTIRDNYNIANFFGYLVFKN